MLLVPRNDENDKMHIRENFTPEISIRFSMADYNEEGGLVNLPLYAINGIE